MISLDPHRLTVADLPDDALRIVTFRGSEAMSALYRFDIRVTASLDAGDLAPSLLLRRATLLLDGGPAPRAVHGIIAAATAEAVAVRDRHVLRLRVVPQAWLLKRRRARRIFQDMSTPEIVTAILGERGVAHELRARAAYPKRGYCVQYDETEYAFLRRILAEDGLFFWFEHPTSGSDDTLPGGGFTERLVITDSADDYPPLAGGEALAFRDAGQDTGRLAEEHHVSRFALRHGVRPRAALLRERDYLRPLLALRDAAVAPEVLSETINGADARGPTTLSREQSDLLGSPAIVAQTIESHRGDHDERRVDPTHAAAFLEQTRSKATVATGETASRRLAPGHRFTLDDHPIERLNRGYVVTSVEHEGRSPEITGRGQPLYTARFECAPSAVRVRPARPRSVVQQVAETASVVGPDGQEIHTDELGRVRVKMHWEHDGPGDERSTCWMRVVQAWAGAGWGSQWVPRVGMEVLVSYLGGDVDRPVVVGCLYNGTHLPPFALPEKKTQSGIRTQSTPGGPGYNEIVVEDAKGRERIGVRAERDLDEVVLRRRSATIGQNQDTSIGGASSMTVGGASTVAIGGDHSHAVRGATRVDLDGPLVERMLGGKNCTVRGALTTRVDGQILSSCTGTCSLSVGKTLSAAIGTEEQPADVTVHAFGGYRLGTEETFTVLAKAKLVLECGTSRFAMHPDRIEIEADEVVVKGRTSASVVGAGPALHVSDEAEIVAKTISFYADDSSIELGAHADIRGKLVRLNCNPRTPPQPREGVTEARETKPFRTILADVDFNPYAGKHYQLIADGQKLSGVTAADGLVDEQVPKSAKVAEIVAWVEDWPTGKRKSWNVEIPDELPPPTTPNGARLRLRNLGYDPGPDDDLEDGELDDTTAAAVKAFQGDHELQKTGRLDAPTAAALEETHGA